MTVHTGTVAQFCCVGNGVVDLIWMVDGRHSTDTYNKAQGIFFNYTSSSSDPIESTLFVPASCQTNNSSIQCGVRSSFTSNYVFSGIATLTVLPGTYVQVNMYYKKFVNCIVARCIYMYIFTCIIIQSMTCRVQ